MICRSSPAQKAAVVRMMMEYEMSQAEGNTTGLLKWYRRQMKKQVDFMPLLPLFLFLWLLCFSCIITALEYEIVIGSVVDTAGGSHAGDWGWCK